MRIFLRRRRIYAIFVNLTAAYDTIWHCGLTCKQLRLLPDKHMVRMIMELVRNQSVTLTTGDSKQSRLRRLKTAFLRDWSLLPFYSQRWSRDTVLRVRHKTRLWGSETETRLRSSKTEARRDFGVSRPRRDMR